MVLPRVLGREGIKFFPKKEQVNLNNKPSSSNKLIWIIVPIVFVFFLSIWAVLLIYFIKQGGFTSKQEVIFELDDSLINSVTRAELKETAFILTQRWEALGYTQRGVSFTVSDDDQIIGRLPEDIDDNVIENLKKTGMVEFVDFGDTYISPGTTVNTDLYSDLFQPVEGTTWHTIMTNSDIMTAEVATDSSGNYSINFGLTEPGTAILTEYTEKNIGKYLGIVMDKVVISCPYIIAVILDGEGMISGQFTLDTAQDLASLLTTSPLPIPLK